MKTGMKPKSILIKKYENRRLYDATNSRYVNLDEVAKMMQNGGSVRVVDVTTGEDITRLILTQIRGREDAGFHFPVGCLAPADDRLGGRQARRALSDI